MLGSFIPKWKKLIHEVLSYLLKNVTKERHSDYLEYSRGHLPLGDSNDLEPVVGIAVPPLHFPQPRQHLEIHRHLEIWRDFLVHWLAGWLVSCYSA